MLGFWSVNQSYDAKNILQCDLVSKFHVFNSCLLGPLRVFEALDSDPMLVKTIDAQSPVGHTLQLKVGAQARASMLS